MNVLVLIIHRGIGLVDISLHPNEPHMWKHFAQRILEEDDNDFKLVREANPHLIQFSKEENWDQIIQAWDEYWDGEKYTDFEIFDIDPAEFPRTAQTSNAT